MTDDNHGADNIRQMFEDGETIPPEPPDHDGDAGGGGVARKRAKGPPWTLPEDAPVEPLGISGDYYYFIDANRQLRTVRDDKMSRGKTQGLFGCHISYLYDVYPRLKAVTIDGKECWIVTGWMPEAAEEALRHACASRGVWDVMNRVRGPGAWTGPGGELVFHCGDAIWAGPAPGNGAGVYETPGLFGKLVYPSAMAGPRPHDEPQPGGEKGAGWELLELLKTWNWRRGETDARLLLGWMGAAMLGGALTWRPMCWITGDQATGKSTLHDVLKMVIGTILSTSNTTAAGIWQKVGHASLPVAIDELEAGADNRKANAVIELAREAASGGVILRGGQDHTGAEFTARNCFLFSSILIPPLTGADLSRMAILELDPLVGVTPPKLDAAVLGELGRRLRRRLADQWETFGERLECWRQQLAASGHKGRGADQYGTLLAVADALLFDEMPWAAEDEDGDRRVAWTRPLSADLLAARDDNSSNHRDCVQHMLTSPADAWRGGKMDLIGVYIRRAAQLDPVSGDVLTTVAEADDILGRIGLKVVSEDREGARTQFLCVANTHQGLAAVFRDTGWAGISGKTSVWKQAMRRLAWRPKDGPEIRAFAGSRSFNGIGCRCTLVPLGAVFPDDYREG